MNEISVLVSAFPGLFPGASSSLSKPVFSIIVPRNLGRTCVSLYASSSLLWLHLPLHFFFSVPQKEHHAPRSHDCTAEHFCMGSDAVPVSQLPQKAPGRSWVLRSTVIWGSYLRMRVVLVPFLLLS